MEELVYTTEVTLCIVFSGGRDPSKFTNGSFEKQSNTASETCSGDKHFLMIARGFTFCHPDVNVPCYKVPTLSCLNVGTVKQLP